MLKRLSNGMKAATQRHADSGGPVRFALAYYPRLVTGLVLASVQR